jgi:hypothetical protein
MNGEPKGLAFAGGFRRHSYYKRAAWRRNDRSLNEANAGISRRLTGRDSAQEARQIDVVANPNR